MKDVKFYIGPMSKTIVDSVIKLYGSNNVFGFIPSRRQVEFDGGYVNNWTTKSFSKYVKHQNKDIIIERDHGGVLQGKEEDNGLLSFTYDSKYFNIIHVDPWKKYQSLDDAIKITSNNIRYCNSINNNVLFEVGTEEAIRPYSAFELNKFLKGLKLELGGLYDKIIYAVVQCGTKIEGITNVGIFNFNRCSDMINVCKSYNLLSKEHNGDYLNIDQIKERFNLGLDAINIAPEFGVIETMSILKQLNNYDEFYDLCLRSKKWVKWVPKNFDPNKNKELIVKICGHYVFSDNKFKNIRDTIDESIVLKDINNKLSELLCAIK